MLMSEHQEQVKLINWCRLNKVFVFAVPNGGTRTKVEAMRLKKEGVVSGVSDLIVMLDKKALFIELKVAKKVLKSGKLSTANSKVSDAQKLFYNRIKKFSYAEPFIAYGADEAIEFIEEYI